MQVDLEAPDDLIAVLAARAAATPVRAPTPGVRAALSVSAPDLALSTVTVDVDCACFDDAGLAIWEWYRTSRRRVAGPYRLATYLPTGTWGTQTLRPSSCVADITRFLATLATLDVATPDRPCDISGGVGSASKAVAR